MALALVLVVLDTAASLVLPILIRHGVDDGISAGVMRVVWVMSGLALLVVGADYLVQRWQGVAAGKAGETVLYQLRVREFAHLQRLGLDYDERELAGRIMTRMTTDVDALSSFLQTGLVTFVVSLVTFIGIAVVLVVMNLSLALHRVHRGAVPAGGHDHLRGWSSRAYSEAREKARRGERGPAGERRRAPGFPGAGSARETNDVGFRRPQRRLSPVQNAGPDGDLDLLPVRGPVVRTRRRPRARGGRRSDWSPGR